MAQRQGVASVARRGRAAVGWCYECYECYGCYGFKLHGVVKAWGKLLAGALSAGEEALKL